MDRINDIQELVLCSYKYIYMVSAVKLLRCMAVRRNTYHSVLPILTIIQHPLLLI